MLSDLLSDMRPSVKALLQTDGQTDDMLVAYARHDNMASPAKKSVGCEHDVAWPTSSIIGPVTYSFNLYE